MSSLYTSHIRPRTLLPIHHSRNLHTLPRHREHSLKPFIPDLPHKRQLILRRSLIYRPRSHVCSPIPTHISRSTRAVLLDDQVRTGGWCGVPDVLEATVALDEVRGGELGGPADVGVAIGTVFFENGNLAVVHYGVTVWQYFGGAL